MSAAAESRATASSEWAEAVRTLASVTIAGTLLSVLVGGVGGRLAMMLLARLNPEQVGHLTDNGFTIGQFSPFGSIFLLGFAWFFGMWAAALYLLVRGLLIGPRWFQVLSVSVLAGVVGGAFIVEAGGGTRTAVAEDIDFIVLGPLWLTVGLFVALPALSGALLTLLSERWISAGGWIARARLRPLQVATVVLWLPQLPILIGIALVWGGLGILDEVPPLRRVVSSPALAWLARLALVVITLLAAADLISDAAAISRRHA